MSVPKNVSFQGFQPFSLGGQHGNKGNKGHLTWKPDRDRPYGSLGYEQKIFSSAPHHQSPFKETRTFSICCTLERAAFPLSK
jgi:hypothetical protein